MKTSIRYLLSLSFPALVRLIRIKLSGKEYLVTGKCNCCGQCCELINLRSHKGWIRHKKDFRELKKECPEYNRYSIISKDHQGYLQFNCVFFDADQGCKDYANRPEICRKYPNKSLIVQGGQLLKGCGYAIEVGTPFAKHLTSEMKKKTKNV